MRKLKINYQELPTISSYFYAPDGNRFMKILGTVDRLWWSPERVTYHSEGRRPSLTDPSGAITEHLQYLPFGEEFIYQKSNSASITAVHTFSGKEFDMESGYSYFGARYYEANLSVWLSVDPLSELDPSWSPYNYTLNNPIMLIDPDGRSTHTDSEGNVLVVYKDDDNGVYKHAKGTTKETIDNKHGSMVLKNPTGAGGEKMGETEHWDEFISPEDGSTMTNYQIQFGKSFDPIIEAMHERSKDMDLIQIGSASSENGDFDIKVPYANVGALLNGKYVTSRSAGNFSAGYNASTGTYLGFGISHKTFQQLAGALHIEGSNGKHLTKLQRVDIVILGYYVSSDISKFVAPYYGEVNYQYRMSLAGWNYGKRK